MKKEALTLSIFTLVSSSLSAAHAIEDQYTLSGSNFVYGAKASEVCLNLADHDKFSIKIIDFVSSDKKRIFKKTDAMGLMLESTAFSVKGKTAKIPASININTSSKNGGLIQLPVANKPVIHGLDLVTKEDAITRISINYKLFKKESSTVFGRFFSKLVEATGNVIGDTFTFGQVNFGTLAVSTFNDFFNTEVKKDDKLTSDADLNLEIVRSASECAEDKTFNGTLIHVFSPPTQGNGFIPLTELGAYCYGTRFRPTHEILYWPRSNDCKQVPQTATKLLNPHIGFLVTASARVTTTASLNEGTVSLRQAQLDEANVYDLCQSAGVLPQDCIVPSNSIGYFPPEWPGRN